MTDANAASNTDTRDLRRLLREVSREAKKSKTPVFIAFLAAFLALVSMADGDVGKRAMITHIESANQFAYYQAKNIRETDAEIAADMFKSMGNLDIASKWKAKADRYDSEKSDILKTARAEQVKRGIAIRQGGYYGAAIALLQISIVLASASLILGGGVLLSGSFVLTAIATIFAINGHGLYWDLPTSPMELTQWVSARVAQFSGS